MKQVCCVVMLSILSVGYLDCALADEYLQRKESIRSRSAAARRVPVIPPRDKPLRVIIDTDAQNEIDDVWAIALAMMCPERFRIEGFVAANYDNDSPGAGVDSIQASARLIETTLLGQA
ncbi:MAG: hypothetical protein IH624_00915 [Phycisphaerae bacterium]|nr:hypothetical protein [Phycisphaerae bacterium]